METKTLDEVRDIPRHRGEDMDAFLEVDEHRRAGVGTEYDIPSMDLSVEALRASQKNGHLLRVRGASGTRFVTIK